MAVISGDSGGGKRRADAVGKSRSPRTTSSKKAIRNPDSGSGLETRGLRRLDRSTSSSVGGAGVLNRSSSTVPSDPRSSRELVADQAATSRSLVGPRLSNDSSTAAGTESRSAYSEAELQEQLEGQVTGPRNPEDREDADAAQTAVAILGPEPESDDSSESTGFENIDGPVTGSVDGAGVGATGTASISAERGGFGGFIDDLGEGVGNVRETVGEAADSGYSAIVNVQADISTGVTDAAGSALGSALDGVGAHGVADQVRQAADGATEHLQEQADFAEEQGLGASLVRGFDDLGNVASGIIEAGSETINRPVEFLASAGTSALESGGDRVADLLDDVGAGGVADAVRGSTQIASEQILNIVEQQSEVVHDVFYGVGEGVNSAVTGVGAAAGNPIATVQGLSTVLEAANPLLLPGQIIRNGGDVGGTVQQNVEVLQAVGEGLIAPAIESGREEGVVAGIAHAGFDILTTIGTGGGGAATHVDDAAVVANALDNIVGAVDNVAGAADNVAGVADNVVGAADNVAGAADNATASADNVTGSVQETPGSTTNTRPGQNSDVVVDDISPNGLIDDLPPGVRELDQNSIAEIIDRTEVDIPEGLENPLVRPTSAQFYDEAGLGPQFEFQVGDQSVAVSRPYQATINGGGSRPAVVAYIEDADGVVRPRSLYLSNSQGGWREASHAGITGGGGGISDWIGKGGDGIAEFATDLPIQTQQPLNGLLGGAPPLELAADISRQAFLGNLPFGESSTSVPFSQATNNVQGLGVGEALGDTRFIEPSSFQYNSPGQAPNFANGPGAEFTVQHPIRGEISAQSFTSADGSLEYLFYTDDGGRAWIGQVDNLDSPINEFGVRSEPIDPGSLTTPAIEYDTQVPPGFAGPSVGNGYVDISQYTHSLPPVRDYLNWLAAS